MSLWMLMTLQALATSPSSQLALRFLDRGNPRLAIKSTRSAINNNPDDHNLMSIYAAASADAGLWFDAWAAFELSAESQFDQERGFRHRAISLDQQAKHEAAADLRFEHIRHTPMRNGTRIQVIVDGIDGARDAGMLELAFQFAEFGEYLYPYSSMILASTAELYLSIDDIDNAMAYAWLSEVHGSRSHRTKVAWARLSIAAGNPSWAISLLGRKQISKDKTDMIGLKADAIMHLEGPEEALEFLDRPRFRYNNSPDITLVRAKASCYLREKLTCTKYRRMLQLFLGSNRHHNELESFISFMD